MLLESDTGERAIDPNSKRSFCAGRIHLIDIFAFLFDFRSHFGSRAISVRIDIVNRFVSVFLCALNFVLLLWLRVNFL